MKRPRSADDVVGLDIDGPYIKAALIRDGIPLALYERLALPSPDPKEMARAQADALRRLWKEVRLPQRASVSIRGAGVAGTMLIPDPGDEKELGQAVLLNAPVALELPEGSTDAGRGKKGVEKQVVTYSVLWRTERQVELIIAAAPKVAISGTVGVAKSARLKATRAELATTAQLRALEALTVDEDTCAVLDIGGTTTQVTVLRGGAIEFMRTIPRGAKNITDALLGLTDGNWEKAEQLKRQIGVIGTTRDEKTALLPVIDQLTADISGAIARYRETTPNASLDRVFVLGQDAGLPDMLDTLATHLPVRDVTAAPVRAELALGRDALRFACALALSGGGEGANLLAPPKQETRQRTRYAKVEGRRKMPAEYSYALVAALLLAGVAWFAGGWLGTRADELALQAQQIQVSDAALLQASPLYQQANEQLSANGDSARSFGAVLGNLGDQLVANPGATVTSVSVEPDRQRVVITLGGKDMSEATAAKIAQALTTEGASARLVAGTTIEVGV